MSSFISNNKTIVKPEYYKKQADSNYKKFDKLLKS